MPPSFRLDRSSFLKLSLLGVGALVLEGCTATPSGKASPKGTSAQAKDTAVSFAAPAGVYQTTFTQKIFPQFEKDTGIAVTYVPGGADQNFATVQAEKGAGGIDVFWGTDLNIVEGSSTVFEKLDPSRLSNAKNLSKSFSIEEGTGVPIASLGVGLFYDENVFKQQGWKPIADWNDLLDSKFKGRVGVSTLPSAISEAALVQVALLNGGSEKNIGPGIDWFVKLKPQLVGPPVQATVLDTLIQQGNAALGIYHGARIQQLTTAANPIKFILPKSGTPVVTQTASIVKGSKNQDAAYQLIDYLLSESVQKQLPAELGYGPTTNTPVTGAGAGFVPSSKNKITTINWQLVAANVNTWTDDWNKQVVG